MIDRSTLVALAGAHLWQSVALATVVFLALVLGRRMRGSLRYALAATGFAGAIVLPLAALLPGEGLVRWAAAALNAPIDMVDAGGTRAMPGVAPQETSAKAGLVPSVRSPDGMIITGGADAPTTTASGIVAPASPVLKAAGVPDLSTSAVPAARWSLPNVDLPKLDNRITGWLLLAWAMVSLVLLARLLGDVLAVERLVARAHPIQLPGALRARFGTLRVLVSEEADGPMAAGLFRPAVILPQDADLLLARAGAAALLEHERAHIQRGDLHAAFVQRLALALLWWSPGLYWMSRRMDEEREVACDDDAVTATGDARSFALTLTEEAKMRLLRSAPRLAVGVIGSRSRFAARVRRLAEPVNRDAGDDWAGRAAFAALGLTVMAAALLTPRLAADAQQPPTAPPAPPRTTQEVPAPAPVPAPTPAPAPSVAPTPPAPPHAIVIQEGELTPELKELVDRLRKDGAAGDGKSKIVSVQVNKGADGDKKAQVFAFSTRTDGKTDATESGTDDDKSGAPKVLRFSFNGTSPDGAKPEDGALAGDVQAFAFDLSANITEGVLKELPMLLAQLGPQMRDGEIPEEARKAIEEALKDIQLDGSATVRIDARNALEGARAALADRKMSIVIARDAMADAQKAAKSALDAGAAAEAASKAAGDADAAADAAKEHMVIVRSAGPTIRMVRAGSSATDGLNRALATTAQRGDENAVKALLKAGADANGIVPGEDSALIQAVRAGDAATVKVLLDAGADASKATSTGETPLAAAKAAGKSSIERMLKAHGARE